MITKEEIKGEKGEIEVTSLLGKDGWEIRISDRLGLSPKKGLWHFIEVKNKEPWEPPPSYQQGLSMYQYTFYKQIHHLFGLRTILIVKGKNDEWLAEFMDNLKPNNYRQLKDSKNYAFFNLDQFSPYDKFIEGL